MQGREFSLEKSTGQKNRRGRKIDGAEKSTGGHWILLPIPQRLWSLQSFISVRMELRLRLS